MKKLSQLSHLISSTKCSNNVKHKIEKFIEGGEFGSFPTWRIKGQFIPSFTFFQLLKPVEMNTSDPGRPIGFLLKR